MTLVGDCDRADDAASAGATNTPAYLRGATRITGAETSRWVRRARKIEKNEATQAALGDGVIHPEQADVIVACVDELADEVADQREAAEQHLLELADQHDAKTLRALAKHPTTGGSEAEASAAAVVLERGVVVASSPS